MSRGILYKNCDNLKVLESLPEKSYDLIYLDVPHFSSSDSFTFMYMSEKQKKSDIQKYSEFISHIIENTSRLLNEDGILCFLSPGTEYVDINYRLILDQFYSSSMNVTLERRVRPYLNSGQRANNDILYFYSKKPDHEFPVLTEPAPIEQFGFKDDFDYYNKVSLFTRINRKNMRFEWQDIIPSEGTSWRYSKEKLDQLFRKTELKLLMTVPF